MDLLGGNEALLLAGSQCHRITESLSVGTAFDNPFHRLIREVPQFRGNGEPGFIKRLCINPGTDSGVGEGYVATGLYPYLAIDAHALVGRTRVPVHKADIRITRLGTEHLDGEDILLGNGLGDVKLELPECPSHFLTVGYLLTVEPDVGPITDAAEVEQRVFTFFQGRQVECGAIPPTFIELCFVDPGIVLSRQCLGFEAVGRQHTHQGRGYLGGNPAVGISIRC